MFIKKNNVYYNTHFTGLKKIMYIEVFNGISFIHSLRNTYTVYIYVSGTVPSSSQTTLNKTHQ